MKIRGYDDWKTANPNDEDHRDDCCAVVNSHWQSPRCNCSELDEEVEQGRVER